MRTTGAKRPPEDLMVWLSGETGRQTVPHGGHGMHERPPSLSRYYAWAGDKVVMDWVLRGGTKWRGIATRLCLIL